MTEPKTLKQLMRESFGDETTVFYFYITTQETTSIEAVKEWLTQKFDSLNPDGKQYYNSNNPEEMQTCGARKILKELLEELNK